MAITVSLKDVFEKRLRFLAGLKFGSKKGSMAKVIELAIEKLENEDNRKTIVLRQVALMKKGFDMGKINFKHRSELYDR